MPQVLLALLIFLLPVKGFSEEPSTDENVEIDPLALASVLIQDKHFERARAVLQDVDVTDRSLDIEWSRYHMLYGLTLLELQDHKGAARELEKAVKAGQKDPMVHIFLAQARFYLEDFKGAVKAIESAGKTADTLPGVHLLKTQCYWRDGNHAAAFKAITKGLKQNPDDELLLKNRVLLLVDMGLYQQAVDEGTAYLAHKADGPDEYAAFSEALIKAKRYDDAVVLLESARLRYPKDKNVVIQLARAYMEGGHLFISARLFEHASRLTPELTLDAAELYRRAGRLPSAVRLNAKVADQKAKVRQRLGLLIELERFEEAAALEQRLSRLGLLEEDTVVYGLAYAFFMTGRFEQAEAELKKISEADLFEKAIQLRRIMGTCVTSGTQCP